MTQPRIALLGMGLIGSSLGHALKHYGLAGHVSGYARSQETRARALEIGFVDSVHDTAIDACADADIVFFNTPLSACCRLGQRNYSQPQRQCHFDRCRLSEKRHY
jgi:cyclohexadieny/prephenate dehydrogenase